MYEDVDDDLWEKGLQLAYFIVPQRVTAFEILRQALTKLEVQRSREYKRRYWRDKNLKGKIRRIAREQRDALQWLIYLESEPQEKHREEAYEQTLDDMVVWYIKYLVQMTTAMSSLYVNIGLHRLVHDYNTPEVRKVYEWITGHHPGYGEYRKVKGVLMEKLRTRFKDCVRGCTGDRRELRFEVFENQEAWTELVDECLRTFIPWSTAQVCPTIANLGGNWAHLLKYLSARGYRRVDQDALETKRCHAFIDPACYAEITHRLGLEHPHQRLAIPKFFLSTNRNGGGNLRGLQGEARHLTDEERAALTDHLHAEASLRAQITPKVLTIVAHGKVFAQFDLTREQEHSFEIPEGIKLLEIWGEDETGKVLLATHSIRYREWQGIAPATATVDFRNKMQLMLRISPRTLEHEASGALVNLRYRRSARLARVKDWLTSSALWSAPWPKYATAGLLLLGMGLVLGWIAGKARFAHEIVRQNAQIETLSKELAAERSGSQQHGIQATQNIPVFRLIPDKAAIREHGKSEPVVSVSPQATLAHLELPIFEQKQLVYRAVLTPFLEKKEILTENWLTAKRIDGNSVITFVLPTSSVQSDTDYVLHLQSIDPSGHPQDVLNFTFYIEKK